MKLTLKKQQEICIGCQLCCTQLGFYIPNETVVIDFYNVRGCNVYQRSDGETIASIPMECQHLYEGGCAIYSSRPQVCRDYNGILEFGDQCGLYGHDLGDR